MEPNLLIIEDDPEFADYLRRGLTYEGYHVSAVTSAEIGLEQLRQDQPDLVMLDVMLPDMDGLTACRRLRESGCASPVLMLTARDAVPDRVTGLESGADDYLVKPVAFDELLARIRALLRRTSAMSSVLTFSDLELDTAARIAHRRNEIIRLSRTEYELLTLFLAHPRQALTRAAILENVWGFERECDANVLDVYVSRLRRKLGDPPLIHTLHRVGYILKEEAE